VRRKRTAPLVLLALASAFTILSLSGYQATSETAAQRLLGRLFGAMIEIDRWLPAHVDDLRAAAEERRAGVVQVDALPVPVRIRGEDVVAADEDTLKDTILAEAGWMLHSRGLDAFEEDGNRGSLALNDPVRWTVLLLSSDAHAVWRVMLLGGLGLTLLLALLVAVSVVGSRLKAVAGSIAAGALIAGLLSAMLWGGMHLGSTAARSLVDREIGLIFRDAAWLGIRNGAAVLVAALAFWLVGALAGRRESYASDVWPEAIDEVG
jgi:hypothetical protein